MTGILTLVSSVAGLVLAWANDLTEDRIDKVKSERKLAAVRSVLPPCDNFNTNSAVTITHNGKEHTFYIAVKEGLYAGAAFETVSKKGYGGDIGVMVGVNAEGTVQGIEILSHEETPGLGARIENPGFKSRFAGRDLKKTQWKVEKDGGDIDQITSATISSRAVAETAGKGIELYLEHEDEIRSAAKQR
ncbi:MAG: RnfABCDGE type electron transport complex subunit G [Kiritimatiellia bacterium]